MNCGENEADCSSFICASETLADSERGNWHI